MHKKHALHPSVTLATYVVHADASVQQHCSPSDQTVAVSIASCKAPEAGAATDTNACMHKAVAACHSCVLVSSGASRTAQAAACARGMAALDKRAAAGKRAAAAAVQWCTTWFTCSTVYRPCVCSRELWQLPSCPLYCLSYIGSPVCSSR